MSDKSENRTFKVKMLIDADQLKRDLTYSLNNLSDAMINQPGMIAHYGVLSAQAARQTDNVKLLLENTEAAVYRKLRDQFAESGEKVTEAQLEKLVTRHAKVIAIKKALNEAKHIEKIAAMAVESFRHRKDMLVQLGADQRQEMQGEIAVRVRESREQALASTKDSILARRQDRD